MAVEVRVNVGIESLFTSALGLVPPWQVEKVELDTCRRLYHEDIVIRLVFDFQVAAAHQEADPGMHHFVGFIGVANQKTAIIEVVFAKLAVISG